MHVFKGEIYFQSQQLLPVDNSIATELVSVVFFSSPVMQQLIPIS